MTTNKLNQIPKYLELVEDVRKWHENLSLENVCLIGVQHLVSTTYSMLNSLFRQGLSPNNVFLVGKCYSSNPYVFEEMIRSGIFVYEDSIFFQSDESYDTTFQRIIAKFIDQILPEIEKRAPKKVIVLDDGGLLLKSIQKRLPLIGIEQTTSGYRALKKTTLEAPIINVARSRTKLIYESPLIAKSALTSIVNHLSRLSIENKKILIIGKGAIGKALAHELRRLNFQNISFYDVISSKCTISDPLQKILPNFDIIIGCTGTTSLNIHDQAFLKPGAVLMSLSSSDREFDAVSYRRKINTFFNCHENLHINNVHLINCGFPINFDDSFDSVDSVEFQLTRALLTLAVFQSASMPQNTPKIFHTLNFEMQKRIIQKYQQYYSSDISKF